MAFGTTPLSTTTLGTDQFPVSAVAVPGETGGNLTALEGGPESTDANGNKTAPASIYVKDGGDITQGASTDANTANTVMGRLTKIRDLLSATLTVAVSGNVTEANSAAIKADLDAINTAIGAVSDAAWTGTGNGSEIAILKKIESVLAATLTVAGTVAATQSGTWTVEPGNTQNTTPWKVDGSGVTQPVSGTITANAGTGTFTNQQSNIQTDYDTGVGTQSMTMFGVALPASGGAVAGGTASNPLRTDPTGTTTQPVSASSLPLPTGAAQEGGNLASISSSTSNTSTVLGATADAAVTGDNTGTLSAKLRGLTKILADIWDSVNHLFHTNIKQVGGTAIDTNSGNKSAGTQRVVLATDQPALINALKVDGSAVTQPVSGTVTANQGGTWTVQPGNTANTTPWLTQPQTGTSGGSTPFHVISAASNNATSVKASAGMVYGYTISNTNASARYVKFYNKASAPAPTTDNTLIVSTIQVPGNATVLAAIPEGLVCSTGIAFAAVANMSDTDNTSISAGDLSIDIRYK